jgi:hypothetical protein
MSDTSIRFRPGGTCVRQVRHWATEFVIQALSIAILIEAAAAQTASAPVIDGREPQPTPSQISRRGDDFVQREVDRLYDAIMRASDPGPGKPSTQRLEAGALR